MAIRPHTSKQYEAELHELREKLLQMGAVVEEMIASAVDALVRRDDKLATETIRRDGDVDALEMEIDELCVHILALRPPAAPVIPGPGAHTAAATVGAAQCARP